MIETTGIGLENAVLPAALHSVGKPTGHISSLCSLMSAEIKGKEFNVVSGA